jgi:hypothetical protein
VIRLEVDGDSLLATGPEELLSDDVVAALGADKQALLAIAEVFPGVAVVSAGTNPTWPPKGGIVPAWRRVSSRKPLIVFPSEQTPSTIAPFAVEPPSTPCPTCTVPQGVQPASERIFETGPWQVCARCQGRRWRATASGDECVACGPAPGRESVPSTWVWSKSAWSCSRCHPPVPPDDRELCEICGAKGRPCGPDHVVRLRQLGEQLLRRTRSAKKRAAIAAALAALPAAEAPAPVASRHSEVVHGWRPPRTTTTRQQREVTWGTPQPDGDA